MSSWRLNRPLMISACVGGCLFFSWTCGVFSFGILPAGGFVDESTPTCLWIFMPVGALIGFLVISQKTVANTRLRLAALEISGLLACLGTVVMYAGVAWDGASLAPDALACTGAFLSGLFSAVLYVSWVVVFGRLGAKTAGVVVCLAVLLGRLLGITLEHVGEYIVPVAAFLVIMPLLSLWCLLRCCSILWQGQESFFRQLHCDNLLRFYGVTVAPSRSFLFFSVCVWSALSFVAVILGEKSLETPLGYGSAFAASLFALFFSLKFLVVPARRISFFVALFLAMLLAICGLMTLTIFDTSTSSVSLLFVRTDGIFFWAIMWLLCVGLVGDVREGSTKMVGRVFASTQGGAVLAGIAVVVADNIGIDIVTYGLTALVAISFCAMILALCFLLRKIKPAENELVAFTCDSDKKDCVPVFSAEQNESSTKTASDEGSATVKELVEPVEEITGFDLRLKRLFDTHGLSPRERDVASCLVRGRDLPYICKSLFISRNTVNTHIKHIYKKMKIHSKQELIDLFEEID